MTNALRIFSDDDMRLLQELVRDKREGRLNTPYRSRYTDSMSDLESPQAPEVYVARPVTGSSIDAISGTGTFEDLPGYELCDIYRVLKNDSDIPELEIINYQVEVYNISDSAILDQWILVSRDKFGQWYAIPMSGGVQIERAIITEVGSSGVHKAFFVTGGYTNDLTAPDVVKNVGDTEVYTGDHIIRNLEPGDNIMVAQVGGQWWIVEVSEDCRGGCVDEPQPLSIPGYIERYKWHMPYIPCCPEASGTWILEAVSESSDTDWESETFQCNSDGTDRKWVYDGTKIQIEPIPGVGSIQYRHEEGNKLCPTKMYKFGGVFPEDCGEFPRVACMVPLCTGKSNANICGGKIHRNWMVTFDGTVTGTGCENFVSGRTYTAIFNDAPSSDITGEFKQVYTGNTVELIGNNGAPSIFVNADPSSTNNRFQLTSHVVYKVRDAGEFNCDGLNILDLDSNTSATCTGFPDTIYAFPIDDEYITSHCCPTSNQPLYNANPGSDTDLESYWHCENLPYNLLLEFTTVANDSCSTCDTFNRVHKLYLDGSARTGGAAYRAYDATHITDCNGFAVSVRYWVNLVVTYTETPYIYISNTTGYPTVSDILYARYELTAGSLSDWNCKGENEFTLISESGYCDFPSTVTIKPCGTA